MAWMTSSVWATAYTLTIRHPVVYRAVTGRDRPLASDPLAAGALAGVRDPLLALPPPPGPSTRVAPAEAVSAALGGAGGGGGRAGVDGGGEATHGVAGALRRVAAAAPPAGAAGFASSPRRGGGGSGGDGGDGGGDDAVDEGGEDACAAPAPPAAAAPAVPVEGARSGAAPAAAPLTLFEAVHGRAAGAPPAAGGARGPGGGVGPRLMRVRAPHAGLAFARSQGAEADGAARMPASLHAMGLAPAAVADNRLGGGAPAPRAIDALLRAARDGDTREE